MPVSSAQYKFQKYVLQSRTQYKTNHLKGETNKSWQSNRIKHYVFVFGFFLDKSSGFSAL